MNEFTIENERKQKEKEIEMKIAQMELDSIPDWVYKYIFPLLIALCLGAGVYMVGLVLWIFIKVNFG